jgi:hypothetical protein
MRMGWGEEIGGGLDVAATTGIANEGTYSA